MKHCIILLILFFITAKITAQEVSQLKIVGDSLVGKTLNGELIREVHGNVVITQDDLTITCNKAVQYIAKNDAELFGNVVVTQDSTVIKTDRGFYFGNSKSAFSKSGIDLYDGRIHLKSVCGYYYFNDKKAFFYSNVKLFDSVSVLSSDSLTYYEDSSKTVAVNHVNVRDSSSILYADSLINYRDTKISYAFNNVRIVDPKNLMIVAGQKFEDRQNDKYSRMSGNPILIKIDTTGGEKTDTLVISSKILETISDSTGKLVAHDSVKIVRGTFASLNNYTEYFRSQQHLFTYKKETDLRSPVIWNDNSQLMGDTINIFLQNNHLEKMFINSNASIITNNPNYNFRFDQISGKNLAMYFDKNGLKLTEVKGNVLSIYYLYEDGEPNGLLKSSSEEAKIYFENNDVNDVRLYGNPVSEYHPENLVLGKEKDFTLPTFLIIKNRPAKNELLKNKNELFKLLNESTLNYGKGITAEK